MQNALRKCKFRNNLGDGFTAPAGIQSRPDPALTPVKSRLEGDNRSEAEIQHEVLSTDERSKDKRTGLIKPSERVIPPGHRKL